MPTPPRHLAVEELCVDQAFLVPDVGSVGRLVAVADGGPGTFLPGDRKRLQTVVAGGDLAHHLPCARPLPGDLAHLWGRRWDQLESRSLI